MSRKSPLSAETIVSQNIREVIFVVISNMDPVAIVLIDLNGHDYVKALILNLTI